MKATLLGTTIALALTAPVTAFPRGIIANANPVPSSFGVQVQDWGFQITECEQRSARIIHSQSKEVICVAAKGNLLPTKTYEYDPQQNILTEVDLSEDVATFREVDRPEDVTTFEEVDRPEDVGTFEGVDRSEDVARSESFDTVDPQISSGSSLGNLELTFSTLYEYNNCLDELMLIYEGRLNRTGYGSLKSPCAVEVVKLYGNPPTREEMLEILDLANFRATKLLDNPVYPALGIRRRVIQNTGYVYDIDENNPEVLRLRRL